MPEPRPPLVIESLRTTRLDLTPLDPAGDAPALHAMLSDPVVHRFDTAATAAASVEETESRLRLQVVANEGTTWAIRLRGHGDAIGTIGVFADQGTTIRGVGWSLIRSFWGDGIMSEAARAAVPFLLAQNGVDGLEAWIDSRNSASLGVARAASMTERGRLPLGYADHVAQTVVMARAAEPRDPEVFVVVATLQVADLAANLRVLQSVLDLHVAWMVPDPAVLAFVAVEPWSGSAGFRLAQTSDAIDPGELLFEIGISADVVHNRVVSLGLPVLGAPMDLSWGRRAMAFGLPDGHRIVVSGPSSTPPL